MIGLQDADKIALVFARSRDFFAGNARFEIEQIVCRRRPWRDRHHRFRGREWLTGGEPLGQHNEVVGKHGTVHIGLEVIESLPVAA